MFVAGASEHVAASGLQDDGGGSMAVADVDGDGDEDLGVVR